MNDQKNQLERKGFKSCCLKASAKMTEEFLMEIRESNLISTSPEAILSTEYRRLFHTDIFKNVICFAVDESHCIKNWGSSSKRSVAFRQNYAELSELRSLVYKKVPMIALTATATKETKHFIMDNLCMTNPKLISSTPERTNIKFLKVNIKERNIGTFFAPLIEQLEDNKYDTTKVLIFCRQMREVSDIYNVFDKHFSSRYNSVETRPYAMFHSTSEEDMKSHILREFTSDKGTIRILISTIAFGMEVNCKGLHTIVHFGPPSSLEDYFQEAGRAGRDGLPSLAVLVTYPRCTGSSHISKGIKAYCRNEIVCRRKVIFSEFGEKYTPLPIKHSCCDVCVKSCDCGNCPQNLEMWWDKSSVDVDRLYSVNRSKKISILRKGQQKFIKDGLLKLRKALPTYQGHCGSNILSGFPLESINDILLIARPDMSEIDLRLGSCLFNENLYADVLSLIRESFRLEEEYDIISEQSDVTSEASESELSESSESDSDGIDSDDSIYRKHHVNLDDPVDFEIDF